MSQDVFTPKERLLRVLNKQEVERPPVICPGGMMNAAIVDVMEKGGNELPEAHHTWEKMSALSDDVQQYTGFENFGVPFCMTVEAEVLGSEINFGSLTCEPKIQKERYASNADVNFLPAGSMEKSERVGAVVQSVYAISRKHPDVPVIGSVTGPVSTAASLVDPMQFLRELRKKPEDAHRVMDYVTNQLIEYASLLVENGAAVISIADPTATGEILGPKMFREYALFYINRLTDEVHALGVPVITHICGKLQAVEDDCAQLHSDALSTDAFVSLPKIKEQYPDITTMGNMSTIMLQNQDPDAIGRRTDQLIRQGINILAPACGLSTTTPLGNIRAFTDAVRES